MKELFYPIYYTALGIDLLPVCLYLIQPKKSNFGKMLFLFVLSSAFTQWVSYGIVIMGYSNLWLVNFYILVEFCLLFFIYKQLLSGSRFFYLTTILFFVLSGVYMIEFKLDTLMYYSMILYQCVFIFFSVLVFITQLKSSHEQNKEYKGYLYFNSSILLYFLSTIILFISYNKINSSNIEIWNLHNIFEILFKLILTYSIWQLPKISR
ncbi:MAG: hypothetical protein K9G36_05865 [Crocinitomicaceae bacterium]|nr:hypothetical protein [Crocinitomicaceae bacterium]